MRLYFGDRDKMWTQVILMNKLHVDIFGMDMDFVKCNSIKNSQTSASEDNLTYVKNSAVPAASNSLTYVKYLHRIILGKRQTQEHKSLTYVNVIIGRIASNKKENPSRPLTYVNKLVPAIAWQPTAYKVIL